MPNTETTGAVLQARDVSKSYRSGQQELHILRNLDLSVQAGETLAIMGASGSGKSTLLNLLGGLDRPDSGSIFLSGADICGLKADQLAGLRNRHLGFVYQFHHLLPEFSAIENVAMPLVIRGLAPREARQEALPLLQQVGLEQRVDHRPAALSGGERQRVAIARSLVSCPDCVLMDEPTGNLDEETAAQVLELILQINREQAVAMVLVTHDARVAANLDKRYQLTDGQLQRL